MTVTIEIPNQVYQKMEHIAGQRTEQTVDILEKFFNEKIENTFESWWIDNKIFSNKDVLIKDNTLTKESRVVRFDIW